MNSLDMVKENCRIASEAEEGHLTEADFATYEAIKKSIRANAKSTVRRIFRFVKNLWRQIRPCGRCPIRSESMRPGCSFSERRSDDNPRERHEQSMAAGGL
jgi:hypothetical protein